MKVVINKCFGGFGLSDEAYEKLIGYGIPVEKSGNDIQNDKPVIFDLELTPKGEDKFTDQLYWRYKGRDGFVSRYSSHGIERNNLLLVRVVEELGEKANTKFSKLAIVEIPDDVEWEIDEYDGMESVEELHRSWS